MSQPTAVCDVALHIPEEPTRGPEWRDQVLAGAALEATVGGAGGPAEWLWERWRVLERAGMDRAQFVGLVVAYRRELWLWLVGDRQWDQCCAGLIGRVTRRLPG